MITTADFRNGMTIELDETLFYLIEFQHVKPGKGGAFVRTKLKNVTTGAVLERTFRAGEKVEEVRLLERKMNYLYSTGDIYYFMDNETYEQISLPKEILENALKFLKENEEVIALVNDNKVIGVRLPIFVDLVVTETEPGFRGNTATAATKLARLETGYVVKVPLFINAGDVIRLDTRTSEYLERV